MVEPGTVRLGGRLRRTRRSRRREGGEAEGRGGTTEVEPGALRPRRLRRRYGARAGAGGTVVAEPGTVRPIPGGTIGNLNIGIPLGRGSDLLTALPASAFDRRAWDFHVWLPGPRTAAELRP